MLTNDKHGKPKLNYPNFTTNNQNKNFLQTSSVIHDPILISSLIGVFAVIGFVGWYILTPLSFIAIAIFTAIFYFSIFKSKKINKLRKTNFILSPLMTIFLFYPLSLGLILLYEGIDGIEFFPRLLILYSFTISFLIVAIIIPLALYRDYMKNKSTIFNSSKIDYFPLMSIIIPAYNEEKVIERTIKSITKARYPNKEIIVVNNASTDNTRKVLQKYQHDVVVLDESKKGKANAINKGIETSKGEIITILDADTVVSEQSLIEIVRPFKDNEKIGAVAANVHVLNKNKIFGKIQVLEYVISMNLFRGILSLFGIVTCISGSFGAYRKSAILDGISAFSSDTITEDFDSTITLLKRGYSTTYQDTAIAHTEVPETLEYYIKQRLRWYIGFFQGIKKHSDFFIKSNYGFSQNLAFFFMINGHIFIPILSFINLVAIIPSLIIYNWEFVISIFLLHLVILSLLAILSIRISHIDSKYFIYVPTTFAYFKILDFVFLKGLFYEIIKKKSSWDHMERTGS